MTEPQIFRLRRGNRPLIVSMPHVGTYVPPPIAERLTPAAHRLEDTDWHVDRLYDFLEPLDVTILVATHSRYVVDLNRSALGGKLYPGKVETPLCPTETFAGAPLYRDGEEPGASEIETRRTTYWQPYHDALAAEIMRLRARHQRIVLFDAHSIRSEVPRLFEGRLPDLNFGTADGVAASRTLVGWMSAAAAGADFTLVVNGRFKGGYITRHYGRPMDGIEAVQLELGWRAYLDQARPEIYDPARAAALVEILRRVIAAGLAALE